MVLFSGVTPGRAEGGAYVTFLLLGGQCWNQISPNPCRTGTLSLCHMSILHGHLILKFISLLIYEVLGIELKSAACKEVFDHVISGTSTFSSLSKFVYFNENK